MLLVARSVESHLHSRTFLCQNARFLEVVSLAVRPLGFFSPSLVNSMRWRAIQRWMEVVVFVSFGVLGATVGCQRGPSDHETVAKPASTGTMVEPRAESAQPDPSTSSDTKQSQSKGKPDEASSAARMVRLKPEQTGVSLTHRLDPDHPMNRLYHSGFICGGVATGDLNGDGRVDLVFASGPDANRVYLQTGSLRFEDATATSGMQDLGRWGTGVTMVDIDNDADLDLYICNYDAPNELWINDGHGHFAERASAFGIDVVDASLIGTFADYDRDGNLDLYLVTYTYYYEKGRPEKPPFTVEGGRVRVLPEFEKYFALTPSGPGRFGIEEYGRADYLFRNQGNGTFTDVTAKAGISGHGFGLSATWFDYDGDNDLDLYVCNDYDDPDRFYQNQGDGTFLDQLLAAVPHTPWSSMGSDAGDLNNDGLLDLFCVDMSATTHYKQKTTMGAMNAAKIKKVAGPPPQVMRNALFVNAGNGRFWEAAYLAGLADSDWSWAPRLVDFDNDGRLDVYISNGAVRSFNDSDYPVQPQMLIGRTYWDLYRNRPERPEQNLAFRNEGELQFADYSRRWGLDHVGMSYGTATCDLDRDGDQDLVVVNLNEPVSIYENRTPTTQRGLQIHLRGRQSNRMGIGAQVELTTPSGRQVRQIQPVTGFLGSSEPAAHFGLAKEDHVERVTIRWPSGIVQTIAKLAKLETSLTIQEPESQGTDRSTGSPQGVVDDVAQDLPREPLYRASNELTDARHREREFDDFALQALLPNKQSHWGPGMAWADVDGDGDEDLYLGGAAGAAGQLWIREAAGEFRRDEADVWEADAEAEDLGALFFDVDSDSDQDLYVVSGGVEAGNRTQNYQDRLYLNDGQGRFARATADVIPTEGNSGGPVVAADIDADGDLDLFVGGRNLPGQYPNSPKSCVLINEKGRLVDRSEIWLPEKGQIGMVTAALWTDVDGDRRLDLLVANDWGPLRYLHNETNRLVDRSSEAGFAKRTGWWNSLTAIDVDHDLDLDYVVGNFGLNTKYHASLEKPALLYYGDFEQNGKMHLVEAEYEGDEVFPIRGRSCSSQSMPFLREKFATYHDFALADLEDLYTSKCLEKARQFTATTLESGIWIHDGAGHFEFRALPRLAQTAPVFGLVRAEMTGDRFPDLWVVQNFYEPQIETGRMDGGLGLLLSATEAGELREWPVLESGLSVPANARSATLSDVNGDAWPDLVASTNDGPLAVFTHQGQGGGRRLRVALQGPPGNLTGIGARVSVRYTDGQEVLEEMNGGAGYLSQHTRWLFFGSQAPSEFQTIRVRWPDGQETEQSIRGEDETIVIAHPGVKSPL